MKRDEMLTYLGYTKIFRPWHQGFVFYEKTTRNSGSILTIVFKKNRFNKTPVDWHIETIVKNELKARNARITLGNDLDWIQQHKHKRRIK